MSRKPSRRLKPRMPLAPTTSRLVAEDFAPTSPATRNSLAWIFEAFEREPSYSCRRMFGCEAAYLDGLIYLVSAAKQEPWNGLLICTSRDRQDALSKEWPQLRPHKILGKWLYVSQDQPEFERIANALCRAVLARDPRLGVVPKPKLRKKRKTASRARTR